LQNEVRFLPGQRIGASLKTFTRSGAKSSIYTSTVIWRSLIGRSESTFSRRLAFPNTSRGPACPGFSISLLCGRISGPRRFEAFWTLPPTDRVCLWGSPVDPLDGMAGFDETFVRDREGLGGP
jgi:hypothetical protein